jgi:hypothetical protein
MPWSLSVVNPDSQARGEVGRSVAWTITIEIRGAKVDAEALVRLEGVFPRAFPDLEADCELWSGWLRVHGIVTATTPSEALICVLATISSAFDQAGIDMDHLSEIANVTMRRGRDIRGTSASDADSLPRTLLRLIPSPHDSSPRRK